MQHLANLLRTKRDGILDEWRRAVVTDASVPHAAELSAPALRDHVPNILDAIIVALESGGSGSEAREGRALAEEKMPREHADARFGQGYTLSALLRELSHLRAAIVEAYWNEHDFDTRGIRFLHAALDECASIAAVQLEHDARRALEEAVEVRERSVAILGHDLRNPLNTVKMVNSVLLSGPGATDEQRGFIARSVRAVDRIAEMIEELLDFTKMRGGALVLDRAPTDLREVCEELVEELRTAQPDRRIVLNAHGEHSGLWDRGRVAQIVSNLLANALAYSPHDTTVHVDVLDGASDVRVAVHNQGEPITKESQKRIFEAFHRGDATGEKPEGIGLGLFIASHLAHAHGGDIEVVSERTSGTTFTVRLPR